ncbi:MAG: bifunctional diaminohydroxyphosphoribosylaminopyrimidine deaminase/5-amino-6-(5-phosphoribosylamino)uracil reductase RibD [Myxococcales bacterium]|nr:bifunctional diaminohydroxyphosphoribosylaminopyrimidine deaminase/5-amino-6-(5-phosphoribosylamino)uracil reductase RibD [Myxococcales bacterium]
MQRCLELAAMAAGQTAPNPVVGCVIVSAAGKVLAEGYHVAAGQPHAEAVALAGLGGKARGATLYCNLEPCRHRSHRRTSPCTDAILAAGVARVVYGASDPIKSHAGGGRLLARAGLAVTSGVLRQACEDINRGFISVARRGRPWVVQKVAMSLDGKIATAAGESKWLTGEAARRDGRSWRKWCDAIVVGVGTVKADDPQLTARGAGARDPMRVVIDSKLSTPPTARVLPRQARGSSARVVIATTAQTLTAAQRSPSSALGKRLRALLAAGAEVWPIGAAPLKRNARPSPKVDIAQLARVLAAQGCLTVLIEGGAKTHGAWLEAGLTDELVLYMAPIALGSGGPSWLAGGAVGTLERAPRFVLAQAPVALGDDLRLQYRRAPLRAI